MPKKIYYSNKEIIISKIWLDNELIFEINNNNNIKRPTWNNYNNNIINNIYLIQYNGVEYKIDPYYDLSNFNETTMTISGDIKGRGAQYLDKTYTISITPKNGYQWEDWVESPTETITLTWGIVNIDWKPKYLNENDELIFTLDNREDTYIYIDNYLYISTLLTNQERNIDFVQTANIQGGIEENHYTPGQDQRLILDSSTYPDLSIYKEEACLKITLSNRNFFSTTLTFKVDIPINVQMDKANGYSYWQMGEEEDEATYTLSFPSYLCQYWSSQYSPDTLIWNLRNEWIQIDQQVRIEDQYIYDREGLKINYIIDPIIINEENIQIDLTFYRNGDFSQLLEGKLDITLKTETQFMRIINNVFKVDFYNYAKLNTEPDLPPDENEQFDHYEISGDGYASTEIGGGDIEYNITFYYYEISNKGNILYSDIASAGGIAAPGSNIYDNIHFNDRSFTWSATLPYSTPNSFNVYISEN